MNLVFLGPPGAGKGTQADLLRERCGLPKYATGDILRAAVRSGSPLGQKARSYMDQGELVPDQVVLGLVREVLSTPEAREGFILDGFPRTVAQAEGLEGLLEEQDRRLDTVVAFEVDEEELVRRLAGRRVCTECGASYNVHTEPPSTPGRCDDCGGDLIVREDDREETVRNRLRVYRESTAPLLDWYEERDVTLTRLEAMGPVEAVHERLLNIVDCA